MISRKSKEEAVADAEFVAINHGAEAAEALGIHHSLATGSHPARRRMQLNSRQVELKLAVPKLAPLIEEKSHRILLIEALHIVGQITDAEYIRFKKL